MAMKGKFKTFLKHFCFVLISVDGIWENWSDWDTCPVTCGGGRHSRFRNCTGPFYNGADCAGPSNETRDCNTLNCPGQNGTGGIYKTRGTKIIDYLSKESSGFSIHRLLVYLCFFDKIKWWKSRRTHGHNRMNDREISLIQRVVVVSKNALYMLYTLNKEKGDLYLMSLAQQFGLISLACGQCVLLMGSSSFRSGQCLPTSNHVTACQYNTTYTCVRSVGLIIYIQYWQFEVFKVLENR